jgi:hypothetical protein
MRKVSAPVITMAFVKFKKYNFVDATLPKVLHDLCFSLNEPLQLASDQYTGILSNINETYKYVEYFLFHLVLIFPVT